MQISVLGHVELTYRTNTVTLKRSKVSQMLSLLIARANETVSVDMLIDELWERQAPRSVQTTLQTYIYHARRTFQGLGCTTAKEMLVTRPSGYALVTDRAGIDAVVFQDQLRSAGHDLETDAQLAADGITKALDLWRGPAFAGIPMGPVLAAHVTYLDELRMSAISQRIEAYRLMGRTRELIPELRSLISQNPLNENFHALLIAALHECGRRAEALQAYQRLWRILDTELGVQPGLEVQALHSSVLS